MSKTLINPLPLPYPYVHLGDVCFRELSDPSLVLFKGIYYLFPSMAGGFYYSFDLVEWEFHRNLSLHLGRTSPCAQVLGNQLVLCAEADTLSFLITEEPLFDHWETVSTTLTMQEPAFFQDEDGRLYLYGTQDQGASIVGRELQPETFQPLTEPVRLIERNPEWIGFERTERRKKTVLTGPFLNRWGGKYYLQYAAPAFSSPTLGDGVYTSSHPLGPYVPQPHTAFSLKPGGFVKGAGHGSTVTDVYGNLWHCAALPIGMNAPEEARLGLFPAGLDADGTLFCSQSFSDYPQALPLGRFDPLSIKPRWMLLSYQAHAQASSALDEYPPELAVDEDIRTCWCAAGGTGEWLLLDLGAAKTVYAVQINLADLQVPSKAVADSLKINHRYLDLDAKRRTRWTLEASMDQQHWTMLSDQSSAATDLPHDYVELEAPVTARYIKLTAVELPYKQLFAVSGLRVFGTSETPAPSEVNTVLSTKEDDQTVSLAWAPSDHAQGYRIRYGIRPDQLYASELVYDAAKTRLSALNAGYHYYAAVDAFGEGGITEGEVFKIS